MKRLSALIFVLLLLFSCESDNPDRTGEGYLLNTKLEGTWVVIAYEDYDRHTVTEKSDVDSWNGLDVTLTFRSDSIYGKNTTNTVSGKFILSDSGIKISSFGGTKMGQPEWGNMFSDVVYRLQTYCITENQLRFYYNNRRNSVTFLRVYIR